MIKIFMVLITSILCFLGFAGFLLQDEKNSDPVIDSNMTFEEAIKGTKAPKTVIDSLCLLNIQYYSFDGKLHRGQLLINNSVKEDVIEIFRLIERTKFPINKAIPIVKYNWSDDASMLDNNTSSFNYRFVANTTHLSNHSYGLAIDINPFLNPVVYPDKRVVPAGAIHDITKAGTLSASNEIVKEFIKKGWRWGGNFITYKDNHHFDKLSKP